VDEAVDKLAVALLVFVDAALLVAHDHQGRKAEAPSALHDLRHTVDVDEPIDELAVALLMSVIAAAAALFTRHLLLFRH